MITRRSFLQSVAMTAFGAATTRAVPFDLTGTTPPPYRVRRNFNSLSANGPEVAALKAGIAAMRSLDAGTGFTTNRTSWGYQRGIHRYTTPAPTPLPVAWNTCTHHGSPGPAFLSWHRAYMYYFERICRAASGYTAFTLPYWNYDKAGESALPTLFLDSTSATLYYTPRNINDGSSIDVLSRGEQNTIGIADFSAFQGALQNCHDLTHGAVGGHMGSVSTAALDPIFYLHHCNIDRCWRQWQLANLNTADPSPLPSWWNTSWTFFDETGTQVAMTGQQAEHTTNLGYVYDDEPKRFIPPVRIQLIPYLRNICQKYPILCQPLFIPNRPPWPLPLIANRPVVLPIRLPAEQTQALSDVKRRTGASSDFGLLSLELVIQWAEGSPNILAEARRVGSPAAAWVTGGAIGSFARGGGRETVSIDVSQVFSRLDARNTQSDLEWRLRFTSGRVGKDGRELPVSDTKAQALLFGAKLTIPSRGVRR